MIITPELGNLSDIELWSDGSACWLETLLPQIFGSPLVLEFRHGLPNLDVFSWQQIVYAGDTLLDNMVEKTSSPLVSCILTLTTFLLIAFMSSSRKDL